MRFLVNCSNLKKGGGLQVAHSFVSELVHFDRHEWYIVLSSELSKQLSTDQLEKQGIHFFYHDIRAGISLSLTGKEKSLADLEKKISPDAVFTVFGPSYWKPRSMHLTGYAKPHYVYPDSPFFAGISLKKRIRLGFKRFFHLHDLRNFSDAIVTESESVTERVRKLFPHKRVYTVSNTYNQVFDFPSDWDKTITLPAFDGISLLTVSASYPHKNLSIIPRVTDILKSRYPLFKFRFILTIDRDDLKGLKEEHLPNILFLGKVFINQCPYLYQQVDFMFLPTLLECFSASYPEAMKMKTPVLTSNLPFAHGICGDAAEYFDPVDPSDIADKIYQLANNSRQTDELKNAGTARLTKFETAKSRAKKYIEILESINETAYSKF